MSTDMSELTEEAEFPKPGVDKPGEDSTIIVDALRKAGVNRQLILRRGEEVTPSPELLALLDVNGPRVEEIGALRTTLLMMNDSARSTKALAVVSPCRGEGRSQLAAELAISFAQLGQSTLLVDANMRRPKLHSLFSCSLELGLADGLAHHAPPHLRAVRGLRHLDFVPAGIPGLANPLELLSDNRFADLMQEWRTRYSFIIIDTPAISEFADGLAVATLAGQVLMVCRSRQTPYAQVKETMRRLAVTRSRVLGAVISDF
jgi:protein-tyrosine kinase